MYAEGWVDADQTFCMVPLRLGRVLQLLSVKPTQVVNARLQRTHVFPHSPLNPQQFERGPVHARQNTICSKCSITLNASATVRQPCRA